MNKQLGESLSALLDGEANELDLERVLKHSGETELRSTWQRYHTISDSLQDRAMESSLDVDLSQRIMAALNEEAPPAIKPVARWQKFLQPAASFAVAASVFAAVLVGSQFYSLLGNGTASESVELADRVSPVGMVNTIGGSAVQAGFATQTVSARGERVADYNALARQRLNRYMLPHMEEATLNAPQGMMPYAKVASFTTED